MTFDLLSALTSAAAPTLIKNAGMVVADNLTLGGVSAIKNSLTEIKALADQSNDNLFYWQIKTFLDTATNDLTEEKVIGFLSSHPQGYRLGAEIFKILESTYIEKQAELIAIAFKQRIRGNISEDSFHKYIHIITQLNHHIIQTLNNDLINVRDHSLHKLPTKDIEISQMGFLHHEVSNGRHNEYSNHSLETLGFIAEDIEKKNDNTSYLFGKKFNRTSLYLSFYLDIYQGQMPS
jgi:hypothetical protein